MGDLIMNFVFWTYNIYNNTNNFNRMFSVQLCLISANLHCVIYQFWGEIKPDFPPQYYS